MAAFLRPDADSFDGNWTNESGSNTNLFASLSETSVSDAEYIQSPVSPGGEICRIGLSNPTGAVQQPFTLSYRFNNLNGGLLTVRLKQGTTVIATWDESGTGWTTQDRTLTGPQFAAITDFTDLFVEFEANGGAAAAALDLDFSAMAGTGLDSRVTFARASSAAYYNAAGVLSTAASGAPRFDYDPITLAPRGLLMEEQRTNVIYNSQEYTAYWENGGGITLGAFVTAPDGTATGRTFNVTNSGASSFHIPLAAGMMSAGQVYSFSVWARKSASGGANKLRMATNNRFTWGTGIGQAFTLTSAWQRFVMTGVVTNNSECNAGICDVRMASDGTVDPNVAELVGNVDLWGAQMELGALATSYIPTTTTAVTRATDLAAMTGTNFSSWWNASAGTFALDVQLSQIGSASVLMSANSAGAPLNDVMWLDVSSGNTALTIISGSVGQSGLFIANALVATPLKIAVAYATNDVAGCENGGSVVTDTTVTLPIGIDQLWIGRGHLGSYWYVPQGWFKRFSYYNIRKTNAELQALTS